MIYNYLINTIFLIIMTVVIGYYINYNYTYIHGITVDNINVYNITIGTHTDEIDIWCIMRGVILYSVAVVIYIIINAINNVMIMTNDMRFEGPSLYIGLSIFIILNCIYSILYLPAYGTEYCVDTTDSYMAGWAVFDIDNIIFIDQIINSITDRDIYNFTLIHNESLYIKDCVNYLHTDNYFIQISFCGATIDSSTGNYLDEIINNYRVTSLIYMFVISVLVFFSSLVRCIVCKDYSITYMNARYKTGLFLEKLLER
jgi:hypothetical protein